MKHVILILLTFAIVTAKAQRLKTKRILQISDSILLANTNEMLFTHFKISVGSYYRYQKNKRYSSAGKFLSKKKLKRRTMEIWVLYHFNHPEIDGVTNGTWIKLDINLGLIDTIALDFIPDFLWKNEPADFIAKREAVTLARKHFEKNGIEILEPVLEYSDSLNFYTYNVTKVLTKGKNQLGKDAGQTEVVILNAVSGELVEKFDGAYGLIIR